MIVDTDYQRGGAGDLMSYMERGDHTLRDSTGKEMTAAEKADFLEKSEEHEFERQIIIAPERDDLSDDQLHRSTRETMNEYLDDQPTADYCYAVHNSDDERAHVHVAATGDIDNGDLFMRRDDIRELRDEIAAEKFHDRDLEQRREQQAEQNRSDQSRYMSEEAWRARLEARKEALREDRSRSQPLPPEGDGEGKIEQIREVVDKEQSRGVAGDLDTDRATAAVLAEVDDLDKLEGDDLEREARSVVRDIDNERGMSR